MLSLGTRSGTYFFRKTAAVIVVTTNKPINLVIQNKLKRTLEHLARHFVASLSLVLGKLNGLWPILVPLVTRQTTKVTNVGTRFPKRN